jgi:NAD(P)-dependent dehydrogenase (short-subunit alcohol dehydrogenase family)
MTSQQQFAWETSFICPERYCNRVAVVTGGASGMGQATVIRILREGGNVVFGDINRLRGNELLEEIGRRGFGNQCRFVCCDVTEEHDVAELTFTAAKEFGHLDLMVNCAGTGGFIGRFLDTTADAWDKTMALILKSVFLGTKAAAKIMIQHRIAGNIVNIASICAMSGGSGGTAYSTAKAGIVNLTRCAAIHLSKRGIRCNVLCPGTIVTPLLTRGDPTNLMNRAAVNSQPWPDVGYPEHVAAGITFLGSEQARFITGTSINVDGGISSGKSVYYEWKQYEDLFAEEN